MTGHSTDTDNLFLTSMDTTRRKLTNAFNQGRIVTASIVTAMEADGVLPDDHAYTVVAYNSGTHRVTVRNPWGTGELTDRSGHALDGIEDGLFQIPLDRFDEEAD